MDQKIDGVDLRIGEVQCMVKNLRCPNSDPHYKMINGLCIYFETTPMNHSDAQANCGNKFEDNIGGLFEPQDSMPQPTLYEEAIKLAEIDHDEAMWIGISPSMNTVPTQLQAAPNYKPPLTYYHSTGEL